MLIGIDARMLGPEQTGIGTYIQYLVKELAWLDKKNEYVLFVLRSGARKLKPESSKLKVVQVTAPWYSWQEQMLLPWIFKKYRLDLMHFPHFNLPILYPGKYVVTIHDLTPKFFPGKGTSWLRKKGYELTLTSAVRRASKIITPSEFTKKDLIKHLGVPGSQIKVIYEGIKDRKSVAKHKQFLEKFSQHKKEAFQRLHSKFKIQGLKLPYILYVGVWRPHKNLVRLIKAFKILRQDWGFKCQLVLVGREDPRHPEIRRTWEKLGFKDDIFTPGFLLGEKLNLFYQAASLFVLPSLAEGFGLVGLEALNQGTPVAVSKIGPLPEILGEAAVYFDPLSPQDMAKKMIQVLKDESLQKDLVKKGQKILPRYSWQKMTQETLEVYQEALSF